MGFPDRSRFGRLHLAVELLEDRTTPAKLDDAVSLALPELVTTGAVAGDRVNVVMASETNNDADAAALAAAPFAASVKSLGFGIYSVTLTSGTDLATAIAYYGQSAGVVSAGADAVVQADQTPNDPSYSSLYGMTKIGAPTAWDTTTGSSNFVVAVIDTGIDYNHPDLAANVWRNPGETAGNGFDDDGNGYIDDVYGWDFANNDNNPFDDNGHGTHVAGTIGAVGNNGVGVAGVNWSVQIMGLKFLNARGSGYTSAAVSALNFAVSHGVKLSNNSWGGGGADATLASAIGRARTAGHIFVAAAGNSGLNIDNSPSYPASYIQSYDNVVTVAATDSNDNLASFSNYGASSVTLAAPGVGILSTTPGNTYSSYSGTSMATPHVTGAIALHWAANPNLTYLQELAVLESSVDAVSGLSGKVATGGRLNVAKMFAGSPPVAPGPKVTAANYSGQGSTQFDSVRITFDRAVDPNTFTTDDITSFTGPNGADLLGAVTGVAGVANSNNTQFDVSFSTQTTPGGYALTFGPDVRDASGNQMNQNGNGTAGEAADQYTASGSLTQTVDRTYSTGTISLAINDLKTTTSRLTVSDDLRISDLNVTVNITHTYDSDLIITLTSPSGKTVTLFNRRGGGGDHLAGTKFDDEAGTAIANGAAPFSGSFRPEAALTAFDGLGTKGVWTLKVSDNARRDSGKLTGWTLSATGTLGGGGSGAGVTTLGFRDEEAVASDAPAPCPVTDDAAVSVAEPIAVTADEPAAGTLSPVGEGNTATTGGLLAWMESRSERTPDELPVVGTGRDDGEFSLTSSAEPRLEADDPFAVASAMLYLAPEEAADVADLFAAFAVE